MLKIVLSVVGSHTEMEGLGIPAPGSTPPGRVSLIETQLHHERPGDPHRLVLLAPQADLERPMPGTANGAGGGIDELPHGTIGALLEARHLIDDDDPLIVADGARWIGISTEALVTHMLDTGSDGLLVTLPAGDAGATTILRDTRGYVTRVVDHDDRSDAVVAGMCVFRRGRDFVRGAEALATDRAPLALVYNPLIDQGARVTLWQVNRDAATVLDVRRRSDLERFLVSVRAGRGMAA